METLFGNFNLEDIYNAYQFAETGSFDNPWIRTTNRKADGGSTAYGPVQITLGLLEDYRDNEPGIYSKHSNVGNKLMEQAGLFKYYGNEGDDLPYHEKHAGLYAAPYRGIMAIQDFLGNFGIGSGEGIREAYDYGGEGSKMHSGLQAEYKDFAQDMMQDMWNKNKNKENPVQSFIEAWRGKTIEEDPDYYKRFNTYLGR
jgi:hypothetical protein